MSPHAIPEAASTEVDDDPRQAAHVIARRSRATVAFHRHCAVGAELEYLARAVESGHLAGDGPFTRRCHEVLTERLAPSTPSPGAVLLTASCTTALEMAALLLKDERRDPGEVIVPGYTFVSTANAFVVHGYRPVFADVRWHDGNIDPESVAAAITPRTRAIVPVHYGGVPCDMDALAALAAPQEIEIVEDAAQALFSSHRGRPAGTLGQLGCFSFHDTKNIGCGEGGALAVNAPRYRERAQYLREKGTNRSRFLRREVDKYTWVDRGGSYLPSELQAAYLLAQLEASDVIQTRRAMVCERYRRGLDELERAGDVVLAHPAPEVEGNHHIFWMLLESEECRAALMRHLAERGIDARTHYVPLHLSPMGRRWGRGPGSLPVVEAFAERLLRLPVHAAMRHDDADRVIDAVRGFFRPRTSAAVAVAS